MKALLKFLTTLITCFISDATFAQTAKLPANLGIGEIELKQFAYAPGVSPRLAGLDTSDQHLFFKYGYYIKYDKVRRDDTFGQPEKNTDTATNDLSFRFVHPVYIIDWLTRKSIAYAGNKDFYTVFPLASEEREPFYRNFGLHENDTVNLLPEQDSIVIGGFMSHKGTVRIKEELLTFYYTLAPLNIISPLNGFLPLSFKGNVLLISFSSNWSHSNGKVHKGISVILISKILDDIPSDTLFSIPASIPFKKNLQLHELYN